MKALNRIVSGLLTLGIAALALFTLIETWEQILGLIAVPLAFLGAHYALKAMKD